MRTQAEQATIDFNSIAYEEIEEQPSLNSYSLFAPSNEPVVPADVDNNLTLHNPAARNILLRDFVSVHSYIPLIFLVSGIGALCAGSLYFAQSRDLPISFHDFSHGFLSIMNNMTLNMPVAMGLDYFMSLCSKLYDEFFSVRSRDESSESKVLRILAITLICAIYNSGNEARNARRNLQEDGFMLSSGQIQIGCLLVAALQLGRYILKKYRAQAPNENETLNENEVINRGVEDTDNFSYFPWQ